MPPRTTRTGTTGPKAPVVPSRVGTVELADVDLEQLVTGVSVRGDAEELHAEDVEVSAARFADLRLIGGRLGRARFTDLEVEACDLSGLDLGEAQWQRVAVAESRVAGVSLAGAGLRDVAFTRVRGARLDARFATLRAVRFTGCDLTEADLTAASLDGVEFVDCRLAQARFAQATLVRTTFTGCDLSAVQGVTGLRDAVVDAATLTTLAPALASAAGIALR